MGPSLWARIQKAEYGVDTRGIANEEEIQDSIFRGESDANRFLGLKRAYTGRLPGKGVYDQQCKLQWFAGQQSEASYSHPMPRRETVHEWLRDQPKTFFVEGIRKLVDRWTKCIGKEGDYIEKWRTCSTPTFV
jgi:hypothetical protein